jgi:hypothetical protein
MQDKMNTERELHWDALTNETENMKEAEDGDLGT